MQCMTRVMTNANEWNVLIKNKEHYKQTRIQCGWKSYWLRQSTSFLRSCKTSNDNEAKPKKKLDRMTVAGEEKWGERERERGGGG